MLKLMIDGLGETLKHVPVILFDCCCCCCCIGSVRMPLIFMRSPSCSYASASYELIVTTLLILFMFKFLTSASNLWRYDVAIRHANYDAR
jgi:hypothetical protein